MAPRTEIDRAAAVRAAMRSVVADRGFHGASMAAVAKAAGVATGTAYTYYESKDDLVLAAYLEVKARAGQAAAAAVDADAAPATRFAQLWRGMLDHLRAHPDDARFLVQVDASPYAGVAHAEAMAVVDDPMAAEAAHADMVEALAPLPPLVLYDLGVAPAVRLVAGGTDLDDATLDRLVEQCWRAVSRPG